MGTEKIHLTLDARMINHSGIGTNLKNMIPILAENYSLTLLSSKKILSSFEWISKVNIIEVNSPIYSLKEQLELPKKIPHCDLFISPHYNIPIFRIKTSKRAVIINDVNHLVFANQLSLHKKLYAKYMINAAISKSDKIMTLSEFSKNEIIKYANVNQKEIKIIFCGIDIEKIKLNLHNKAFEEIQSTYNLPQNYFLYVGSIRPHKDLKTALTAFKIYTEKYQTQKKLVILGVQKDDYNGSDELSKIGDHENLVFPGYVKDEELPLIYKNASCLMFPSIYEGFGLPPVEAMACGCPSIVSNSASLPEVCGEGALFFEPHNAEELIEKMSLLENDSALRNGLIKKGYDNILRFTVEKFGKYLTHEIESILAK